MDREERRNAAKFMNKPEFDLVLSGKSGDSGSVDLSLCTPLSMVISDNLLQSAGRDFLNSSPIRLEGSLTISGECSTSEDSFSDRRNVIVLSAVSVLGQMIIEEQ